jgi:hypothetical protein
VAGISFATTWRLSRRQITNTNKMLRVISNAVRTLSRSLSTDHRVMTPVISEALSYRATTSSALIITSFTVMLRYLPPALYLRRISLSAGKSAHHAVHPLLVGFEDELVHVHRGPLLDLLQGLIAVYPSLRRSTWSIFAKVIPSDRTFRSLPCTAFRIRSIHDPSLDIPPQHPRRSAWAWARRTEKAAAPSSKGLRCVMPNPSKGDGP